MLIKVSLLICNVGQANHDDRDVFNCHTTSSCQVTRLKVYMFTCCLPCISTTKTSSIAFENVAINTTDLPHLMRQAINHSLSMKPP